MSCGERFMKKFSRASLVKFHCTCTIYVVVNTLFLKKFLSECITSAIRCALR